MRNSRALFSGVALLAASAALAFEKPIALTLPDLPVAIVDVRDIAPIQLDIPDMPEIAVRLDVTETTASLPPAAPPASLVPEQPGEPKTAHAAPVTPAQQNEIAAVTGPVPAAPEPTPVPPTIVKPALPEPASATSATVLAEPAAPPATAEIAPPDLPAIVVDLPSVMDLAPAISERAATALALQRLPEKERRDLVQFYAERDNKPLWITPEGWSAKAKGIVARLALAGDDGLFLTDYAVPAFERHDIASLAEADLRLSALAVLYARDARGARIDPRRLSRLITPKLAIPSAAEVIGTLQQAKGSRESDSLLASFNPPHAGYRALRARLEDARKDSSPDAAFVAIPEGPALKVGMRDERVPLVRARLGLGPSQEPVFDRSIAVAVADFQKNAGLPANGILSRQTLAALGAPTTSRLEADLVAQMERWRWLPADLGRDHIIVNVPEYIVRVTRDGSQVHQTKTIVGKPDTPTPIFSDTMDHVVVNPSWFVPPSIMKNEFLPKLAADPDYAAKRGFEVVRRGNNIYVRQPPGERNALGHIKFMFPNDHAVYLHDTPSRGLFNSTRRAFSHGCVRVDQPFRLAEFIMGKDAGYSEARVRSMVGAGERTVKLPKPLPVHLIYMTHVVDEGGRMTTFEDLYGFHALVRSALAQVSRNSRL
jgi:L,D-transpeptidase YcbB